MLVNKAAVVIDPDRADLLILQHALLRLGFVVTAVSRPARVRMTLKSMHSVHVGFLSLDMPGIDAYEVRQHLQDAGIDAPLIAYTAHADQPARIRAAGFQGLVTKPLDIDAFPELLQQMLAGNEIWCSTGDKSSVCGDTGSRWE